MKEHQIDLNMVKPHGQVRTEMKDEMLCMTTTRAIPKRFERGLQILSYIALPGRYSLPLRIDVTAKIDAPALYFLFGNGHVNIGTYWSDNRQLDDICEPHRKPKTFHNYMQMNAFAKISLIYDFNEMQILVDGEERYYSKKEKYMKSPLLAPMNAEGFILKIACDKRTELTIQSVSVTEYDDTAGITHVPVVAAQNTITPPEKPTFASCIANLPEELKDEIVHLDNWLREIKPLKFKRQVEKHGAKITYLASDYGFSYAIHPSNDVLYHTLQWYILTGSKPELWHRKADWMEETLGLLAKTDPGFAQRMFENLDDCVGCGERCKVKTKYSFAGESRVACHGKMRFKMCVADFQDVRRFIGAVNELAQIQDAT